MAGGDGRVDRGLRSPPGAAAACTGPHRCAAGTCLPGRWRAPATGSGPWPPSPSSWLRALTRRVVAEARTVDEFHDRSPRRSRGRSPAAAATRRSGRRGCVSRLPDGPLDDGRQPGPWPPCARSQSAGAHEHHAGVLAWPGASSSRSPRTCQRRWLPGFMKSSSPWRPGTATARDWIARPAAGGSRLMISPGPRWAGSRSACVRTTPPGPRSPP